MHDASLVDRASRVLASAPGGPSLADARRRLSQGWPLIVGLSRAQTEELQQRLADLGLVTRLGPAPEGTAPQGAAARAMPSRAALLALLGGAALVTILFAAWPARSPSRTPQAPATTTTPVTPRQAPLPPRARLRRQPVASPPASETVPAEARLELWARAQIVDAGLAIEGWARVRTSDPPTGPLVLMGRADGAEVLSESLPETDARTQRGAEPGMPVTRTLPFRVSLKRDLGAARELWLEATWGAWRSEPLRIEIPDG